MKAWLDDRIIPVETAQVAASDRGLLLGDGIFETMRLAAGHVARLEDHLARLAEGAALLRLPLPPKTVLRRAVCRVIAENGASAGALRLTLTRGPGPRGLLPPSEPRPTLLVTQTPPMADPGPCRLMPSRYRRDGNSPLSRIKHLNYLPQILARIEAGEAGFDDALLMSQDGTHLAEASAANLVVLTQDGLVTPPLSDGALCGLARARLLEAGLCREGRLDLEALESARAAWLVNALALRRVQSVGRVSLDDAPEWSDRMRETLYGDA